MDVGDVQVEHTQNPTRQLGRNNDLNNEQAKQRKESNSNKNSNKNANNKNKKNLNLVNVENSTKINNNGIKPSSITSPKISQNSFAHQSSKSATFATANKNGSQQNPSRSSSLLSSSNNNNLSKSPPENHRNATSASATTITITSSEQQKSTNLNRSVPKPLNLSKTTSAQLQSLGRVPQSATFPQKINRNYSLPSPPKTATFPKPTSFGFPKDTRQSALKYPTNVSLEQYLTNLELARLRRYNPNLIPTTIVLSHPEDSDSQSSSPLTPRFFLVPENSNNSSTDAYDLYNNTQQYNNYEVYEDELFLDDAQQYYYYYNYDQPQEYISPPTPSSSSSNLNQQRRSNNNNNNNNNNNTKDERRKSVFGGPMKIHPDAVLPIRQPKGPEISKNFTARIRRKAINKLHAAAAERRSRSAADRRKSAMF